MEVQLTREHAWLKRLEGEWTFEMEAAMPDQPPEKITGTESVRMLGDAWAICEQRQEIPGQGTGSSIMTLGYDPERGRFVGTFVTSMMSYLWVYEGTLDEAAAILSLDAEGPDLTTPGKLVKYVDRIELVGPDERMLSSSAPGEDGQWREFMRMRYRRK